MIQDIAADPSQVLLLGAIAVDLAKEVIVVPLQGRGTPFYSLERTVKDNELDLASAGILCAHLAGRRSGRPLNSGC
jgi:hypothetical protein